MKGLWNKIEDTPYFQDIGDKFYSDKQYTCLLYDLSKYYKLLLSVPSVDTVDPDKEMMVDIEIIYFKDFMNHYPMYSSTYNAVSLCDAKEHAIETAKKIASDEIEIWRAIVNNLDKK